jgi:uncharacterized protein YeeX (DUF496 family)
MLLYGKEKYESSKLVSSFLPRKKYVCHYRNLKTYIELGMELKKVHRVIEFTQSKFLKPYVDYCTKKRASSESKFGERLQKLMVNANFGKLMTDTDRPNLLDLYKNKGLTQNENLI